MSATLDRRRLALVLARTESPHDGEALVAARKACALVHAAGASWDDVVDGSEERHLAVAAAQVLLAENNELRDENERLRTELSRGAAVATWREVGAETGNTRGAAQWALDLHAGGDLWLSDFEIDFLRTCMQWRGRLTPKQAPIFRDILDRIVDRTGQPAVTREGV